MVNRTIKLMFYIFSLSNESGKEKPKTARDLKTLPVFPNPFRLDAIGKNIISIRYQGDTSNWNPVVKAQLLCCRTFPALPNAYNP